MKCNLLNVLKEGSSIPHLINQGQPHLSLAWLQQWPGISTTSKAFNLFEVFTQLHVNSQITDPSVGGQDCEMRQKSLWMGLNTVVGDAAISLFDQKTEHGSYNWDFNVQFTFEFVIDIFHRKSFLSNTIF